MTPGLEEISRAPKVALHDHLDGGLRPSTVATIAAEIGHHIPDDSVIFASSDQIRHSGSLTEYLDGFAHTIAVMQRPEDLVRVAREAVEDLARDGVVYAELRWAPEQHLRADITPSGAVEFVRVGIEQGREQAASAGSPIVVNQILTARRETGRSLEIARLAVEHRSDGVVGFDIAGAEAGYPAKDHLPAFDYAARHQLPITIHAGEAFGIASIEQAIDVCGANRIGHGVRIVDDIDVSDLPPKLGAVASYLRDAGVCFELCPSSNLHTGALGPDARIADHPFALLDSCGFNVTVNCDNRLMSHTTLSREFALLVEAFDYSMSDIKRFTVNAMRSAFCSAEVRERLLRDVIEPGFATLGA